MSERKMWDENVIYWVRQEDNMIRRIVEENTIRKQSQKWKWSQIAEKLQNKLSGCVRTGKQCRQRWYNHLDPTISKDKQLTENQISKLFELQNNIGNKWSIIAKEFPGRTDSNLKNFFYSSLRRAIRQINSYICQYKKKSNIKQFKQVILSKILKINDDKYRQKLNIKNQKVNQLAKCIKSMLAKLSLEEQNKQLSINDQKFRDQLVEYIQEFNKNCKKKKQKKVQVLEQQPYLNDLSLDNQINFNATSEQQIKILKQSNHRTVHSKKPAQKVDKYDNQKKVKQRTKPKQQNTIKKQQQDDNQLPKQLFCNPTIDKKKSQIEQLQQQNNLLQWQQQGSQNKMINLSSDFFKKSSFNQFQPLKMFTRKSSYQDNKSHGFISTLEPWKKSQSKLENGIFQSYGNHDLVDPSLLESINIGQTLPKMNQNSITESGFLKLLKVDSKTEQGNIN